LKWCKQYLFKTHKKDCGIGFGDYDEKDTGILREENLTERKGVVFVIHTILKGIKVIFTKFIKVLW